MEQMNILGVHVSATNMPEAVRQIKTWIGDRTRTYVCVTGVHGIMECQDNRRLRAIHNSAGMVTPEPATFPAFATFLVGALLRWGWVRRRGMPPLKVRTSDARLRA